MNKKKPITIIEARVTEVLLMNLSKKTCKQDEYKSEQLNGSGDFRNVKNQTSSPVDNMNLMSSFKQPGHINDKIILYKAPVRCSKGQTGIKLVALQLTPV